MPMLGSLSPSTGVSPTVTRMEACVSCSPAAAMGTQLEYLLIKFSTTKVNGSAVNGGITNEDCKVANITWGYEDTL